MKKSLHSRATGLWFVCACLAIVWIGFGTYESTQRLVRSFDSVSESHQAIQKLQSIQLLMEAGEADVYRYVITGRADRMGPYLQARVQIPRRLREAEALLKGYPEQKKALGQFRQLLSLHERYLAKIVTVRENEGYEAASSWVSEKQDQNIREGWVLLIEQVQKEGKKILRKRAVSTSRLSTKTRVALVSAATVSLLLIAWVFGLLRRETGERKAVESTNQRLETFLRSIVERIPYMVLVKEAETLRLTLVNKAATEWLGRSEDDLLGSNDYDLRPPEAAWIAMEQDREVLRKGEPVDIPEEAFLREKNEGRLLHTQKVAIPDENGDPAFLLTISEDITQRKHAERMLEFSRDTAVQSERLKSEFIRNMSHEIRTPMSILIGMTAILMEDPQLAPEQRKLAAKIHRAVGSLAKLTKEVTDFSKIEAGTFTLEMLEMRLGENVEGILTMLHEQAQAKGVVLKSSIAPEVPAVVVGDPVRLRQVLTELASNALKFTPSGEVCLRVSQTEQNDRGLWLNFEVTDTGPGIEQAAQKHLFEPFRQGDGSPARRFGGTGLGLAISKRIVELMGGKIGFTSVLGKGSTFWCTIPFQKPGSLGRSAGAASPAAGQTCVPARQVRILVVDENEVSRQLLREQLSSWGMANEGVSSGEAALALLRGEQQAGRPFQGVLSDLQLSDMEGVAFARAVKNDPALASTFLLVFCEPPLDPATAASLGFASALHKPPSSETLYACLGRFVKPSSPGHQSAA